MGKKRQRHDSMKRLAVGSVIAAIFGYLAGLLTAPKSGKETRKDIKDTAVKSVAEAEKDLKRLHTELDRVIQDAKTNGEKLSAKAQKELTPLVEKAKDTKEKAREMLSAIHEGDAQDKDLAKAIKDANTAIDHLRDYLKK
ncbi:MAG: YtxH domain-containing protein [Candidatus Saccharimonadales bacterium]